MEQPMTQRAPDDSQGWAACVKADWVKARQ